MADLHPEAIPNLRRARPELADLPDDVIARTFLAHWESLSLYMRDMGSALGRAVRRDVDRLKEMARR